MINKVILLGRVGKDPETQFIQSGAQVTKFSIATSENWKDKQGQKQERTEWHSIISWNQLAKICAEYVTKGMLLYIEGTINTRQWEDQGGARHQRTEIVAHTIKMLGGGKKLAEPAGQATPPSDAAKENEDIPF